MENQALNKFGKEELNELLHAVDQHRETALLSGNEDTYRCMCHWERWIIAAIKDAEFEADVVPDHDTPIIGADGNLYIKG